MYNEFTREVKALRSKGRKLRQLNHLYKAAGLAVAALGGGAGALAGGPGHVGRGGAAGSVQNRAPLPFPVQ